MRHELRQYTLPQCPCFLGTQCFEKRSKRLYAGQIKLSLLSEQRKVRKELLSRLVPLQDPAQIVDQTFVLNKDSQVWQVLMREQSLIDFSDLPYELALHLLTGFLPLLVCLHRQEWGAILSLSCLDYVSRSRFMKRLPQSLVKDVENARDHSSSFLTLISKLTTCGLFL